MNNNFILGLPYTKCLNGNVTKDEFYHFDSSLTSHNSYKEAKCQYKGQFDKSFSYKHVFANKYDRRLFNFYLVHD